MPELGLDTIDEREQRYFRSIAATEFTRHVCEVRSNEDGISWIVLAPCEKGLGLLTFTICKIDPNIIVMVEYLDMPRQYCSTPDIDFAIRFIRSISQRAFEAVQHLHPGPVAVQ